MSTHTIAVAGKGGVGKTTTCGMMIDYLVKKKQGPILVVDADANSNLNEVLGVEVETTLGDIREEMAQAELKGTMPKYMTKAEYADMKFSSALVEEDDFDMLVMGRTQGKGCYCFVNGVLKAQVDKYANNYRYLVIDNEAGLEYLSRGTLPPCGHHAFGVRLLPPGHPGRRPHRRAGEGLGAQAHPALSHRQPRAAGGTECRRVGRNQKARSAPSGGAAPGRACLPV